MTALFFSLFCFCFPIKSFDSLGFVRAQSTNTLTNNRSENKLFEDEETEGCCTSFVSFRCNQFYHYYFIIIFMQSRHPLKTRDFCLFLFARQSARVNFFNSPLTALGTARAVWHCYGLSNLVLSYSFFVYCFLYSRVVAAQAAACF